MPGPLVRKDDEGRGFLVVKRTERLEIAPRFFQSDILSDDINDVDFLFDVIHDRHIVISLNRRKRPNRKSARIASCGSILSQVDWNVKIGTGLR